MINWIECRPDFYIPAWMACERFPPYEDFDPSLPGWDELIVIGDLFRPPPWAWAAWHNALKNDKPLKMDRGLAEQIAGRMYDAKRYVAVVPAWRRHLVDALTEIDDIEDQVSTIAWLSETVLSKFIPIPRSLFKVADNLHNTLDGASEVLSLGITSRKAKSEWTSKKRALAASKRGARTKLAKLVQWFRQNWGNLLEAGQATNTWFDVGIVLGPIMAWVEDGLWGLAKNTLDNYLIAAETFMPGIREAYWEQLRLYGEAIEDRTAEVYENITNWDRDLLQVDYTQYGDPYLNTRATIDSTWSTPIDPDAYDLDLYV